MIQKIKKIRSGGQSGVDRAALDAAKKEGIKICGWCPKGGWAEDYAEAPGVMALYPELQETPLAKVEQRTVWNVRDSDATLIVKPQKSRFSNGTELTEIAAKIFNKPYFEITSVDDASDAVEWLQTLDDHLVLNIGGPRESECVGVYKMTLDILSEFFSVLKD